MRNIFDDRAEENQTARILLIEKKKQKRRDMIIQYKEKKDMLGGQ